ncbi:MAG: Carbohydrate binding family 6 [Pedosphaera sp.]|nr:Carbohydrate binding family 6 [Pedosphaera sp.]
MPCSIASARLYATQAAWIYQSKPYGRIIGRLLVLAGIWTSICRASVPVSDTTLSPVVTDNLPLISSLTAYVYPNDSDAVSNTVNGTVILYDAPLYYPFDTDTAAWWDNLVAEELQARLSVIMFASRGTLTTNATEISGNMNPRQLTQMVNALTRANATNQLKLACFIDSPSLRDVYTSFHGISGTNRLDMSLTNDWNQIFWLRGVKPWFDTVPSQYWFKVNGRPVIQWWSISSTWFANQTTNAAKMLQFLADSFEATYGMRPGFILDGGWANSSDPTSLNQPDVIGMNNWFGPPSTSYTTNTLNGFTCATVVPGFINPGYFDPSNGNYQNPNLVIPHNNSNGTGTNGDTLITGLEAGFVAKSQLTVLEGWNDVREWAGYYRCASSPRYDFPSQYINIVRRYTDYRTETLRLEAEGADDYFDTTAGNSGGAFRRSGDLDIRTLSTNGWVVTATTAGEWIEFREIQFSAGNYAFPVRYSSTASHALRLYVDGVALPDVIVPATGDANLFDTAYLGTAAITHGTHTLRLFFVDGGVDVDWIFVKKFDPIVTFQSALNGAYLTAQFVGNNSLVCNWTTPDNWGRFTVDDLLAGGDLISSNTVNLQAHNGLYLTATNGGSALTARQRIPVSSESFSIVKLGSSGVLTNGDQVAIQTSGGKYVTVKTDGSVDASALSIGAAQTFTIQTTPGAVSVPPVTSAPTALIGIVTNISQIVLSWAATPGATSYNVKRSTVFGGPYTTVAANVLNSTNYLDVRLPFSTTFYYVVSAVNAGGESLNSAVASATIPTPPTLLSQNKSATASSIQGTGFEASKALDGDLGTRWSTAGPVYPSWWRVDLGTNCNLSSVTTDWYGAGGRSYQYKIEVSTNDVNYVLAVDKTSNVSTANSTDIFAATGRYVRITVNGSSQSGGYPSFYECLVYGNVVPSVSLAPTSIAMVASGNTIALSWPEDHLGWRLQVQTNTLGNGLGTNWVTLSGSELVTGTNITISPANGAVFYRLISP